MGTNLIRPITLVALVFLAIGLVALLGEPYSEAKRISQGAKGFGELSERFTTLAQEKGAVYAFEVLKRAALPPDTDLHLLGHVVGEELYKQKGPEGIANCTQGFRNACSHSIVIGTLNEYGGDAALPLIQDACKKAPGGVGAYTMCFHGLGHGVFAYFGYSMPETTEFCAKTGTPAHRERESIECVGGMVMELMGGGMHDREKWLLARERYLTDDPLSPCMSDVIPTEAKEVCFTYLTPRLLEIAGADAGHPDPATFPRAFGLCEGIPESQTRLRRACLGGFGKDFVPLAGARDIRNVSNFSDQEFSTAALWCMKAPTQEGRSACAQEAVASVFWGGENDPDASFRFCSLVPEEVSRSACLKYLAESIASYVKDEALREHLCARLPAELQSDCVLDL